MAIKRTGLWIALAVFVVLLAAYWRTLIPGTVGGDAGELQYAGPLLALVHPTGQPLYVLIGKIWSVIIPFGTIAWKLNLLAAVSTAAGGASLAWLVYRAYGNAIVGMVAGLALGLGATVWGQAVLADKYGFNVLLAAWIIGLAVWWAREHNAPYGDRLLYALSAAFGIGLLHHRSLALFAVGIGIMVIFNLRADLWRKPRRTLICAAWVLLPALIVYPTVLPLLRANDVSPLMWQPSSPGDWVDFLLERHVISGEALVFDDTDSISRQLEIYAETILADYTVIVPLVAVLGAAWMLRTYPLMAVLLLVSYGLQAFLSANFRGNDRQFTYYLPSFVTLLYLFAYGLLVIWRWIVALSAQFPPRYYTLSVAVASLIALGLPLVQIVDTYPDRRTDRLYGQPLTYGEAIWRQTLKTGDMGARLASSLEQLPQNAVLAADWEQITPLWYEQQVEGRRPDLTIVYPIERYTEFDARPICLARHLPIDAEWHPSNVGAFVCLESEPRASLPDGLTPVDTTLYTVDEQPLLSLAGYTAEATAHTAGSYMPLTVYWQALDDIPDNYSISLQILREDWSYVDQRDIQNPVMGMYATSRWQAGEVVGDFHEIPIPRTMPPGRYLWTLVVYQSLPDGQFQALRDVEGNTNILGGVFEVIAG